jgi:hypothetical protein
MSVARIYRVGSPYNAVDLSEVDFEQSADVMYLAHLNYAPGKLTRYAHDSWAFSTITFGPTILAPAAPTVTVTGDPSASGYSATGQSYSITAIDDDSGQESRPSPVTSVANDLTIKGNHNALTWVAVSGAERYRVYRADYQQDFGYIGTTSQIAFTDNNISPDLTDTPPVGDNPFPGAGDYPSTVTFFEQRLFWARTLNNPNAFYASRSGDYDNYDVSRPLKDSDALSARLVAGRVNAINQLVSTTSLLALTSDAIFAISGTGNDDPLTPTQIRSRRQIGRGSSRLGPLVVDNVVFYKPSVGSSMRAINYSFESNGFKSDDLSIFSPHLFHGFDIVWWAYAQEPRSIVWAGRSDGILLCFTWEQDQQVWGWTVCDLGGAALNGCVISETGSDGRVEDRLYLVVKRTINGAEKHYIERMAAVHWETVEDCCFLDCATTYAFDTPADTLTGLDYLEGETLTALIDGNVAEGLTVTGGKVTLPYEGSKVSIGFPYTSLIETLPLSMQTQQGSPIGRKSSVAEAVVRVVATRGVFGGPTDSTQFEVKPRSTEDYGAPNDLKTASLVLDNAADTRDELTYVVTMPYPLPATIAAVLLDPVIGS